MRSYARLGGVGENVKILLVFYYNQSRCRRNFVRKRTGSGGKIGDSRS
jgi:hypothetical protein